jgi:hypothetical protein
MGAAGVVGSTTAYFLTNTTRLRHQRWLRSILLMAQPPLLG